jgi:hypothetical protein
MEPTKQQKIEVLQKNMPKLSFREACQILGYSPDDPELFDVRNIMEFFPWMK